MKKLVLVFIFLVPILLLGIFFSVVGLETNEVVQAFTVNSTLDAVDANPGDGVCETTVNNGICTLRAAVQEANALAGADIINLPAGTYLFTLPGIEDAASKGDLDITDDLTILGTAASSTIIDPNQLDRAFEIFAAKSLIIEDVTVQNGGNVTQGAGFFNQGTLTVRNSVIQNNNLLFSVFAFGGGIYSNSSVEVESSLIRENSSIYQGGGIYSLGTVTVTNSSIISNTVSDFDASGSGIYSFGTGWVTNSTISGNKGNDNASGLGGSGVFTITQSTFANNDQRNIMVASGSSVYVKSTILASDKFTNNCEGGATFISLGHNLERNDDCGFTNPSDIQGVSARLSPLRQVGNTWVHIPLLGSPVIDRGKNAFCSATDQAGQARPVEGDGFGKPTCDMGAFEYIPTLIIPVEFTVNSTIDAVDFNPGDGVCETALNNNVCTLRAAVQESNALAGENIIRLPNNLYTLTITGTEQEDASVNDLDIKENLAIIGEDQNSTVIDGNSEIPIFDIKSGSGYVSIENMTLQNTPQGICNCFNGNLLEVKQVTLQDNVGLFFVLGGSIRNLGFFLLKDALIQNNEGNSLGGAIYNESSGTMIVKRSTILSNTVGSGEGGGIANQGVLTLTDSLISQNEAIGGLFELGIGAISNRSVEGTAILNVYDSTIENNTSTSHGGIYNDGQASLVNSTISGNTSTSTSGGIAQVGGSMSLINATIVNNEGASGSGIYFSGGALTATNSIVANNMNGPNCSGAITSNGNNIDSGNSCNFNQVGDLINTDPLLGPLQDNGGPTFTHAPLAGSPAIDAGTNGVCPDFDQRGYYRPWDGDGDMVAVCDIGAVETNSNPAPFITASSAAVTEDENTAVFSITLSAPASVPVSFSYKTASNVAAAGVDFVSSSGSHTFAPGETVKTVTVNLIDDLLSEENENFFLILFNVEGAIGLDLIGEGLIVEDGTDSSTTNMLYLPVLQKN